MSERAADGSKGLVEAFWERVAEELSVDPAEAASSLAAEPSSAESPDPPGPLSSTPAPPASRPPVPQLPDPTPPVSSPAAPPAFNPPTPPEFPAPPPVSVSPAAVSEAPAPPVSSPPVPRSAPPAPVDPTPHDADLPAPEPGEPHPTAARLASTGQLTEAFMGAYTEPERALADYPLRIDDETLREVADDTHLLELIREGLSRKIADAGDPTTRARVLGLRAVVSRLLGYLKEALDDAERALAHAQTMGSARKVAVARTRLARVLQWRGDHAVADELYQRALDAAIPDRLRAAIHQHAGASCFEQGRFLEAINHFENALALRHSQDAEQLAVTGRAFTAISRRAGEVGFGPFPRTRAEILQEPPPPRLRFHEGFRRYGYAGPDGKVLIAPSFHQAYPFSDGHAWVRAEEGDGWGLIDTAGERHIASTEYRSVGPFTEGLAWVMSDPVVGWQAIDSRGIVIVPPAGYADARPFHHGLAVVRRNGAWGAVDRDGREVIPMEYDAFRTARSDSRYLTGFTEEGLAVIERGGLLGVINRANDMVVPPAFQVLEIHPLAYLVAPPVKAPDYSDPFRSATKTGDMADGWGALDRSGELVIETVHPNRQAVLEELEKLLRDAHPIL